MSAHLAINGFGRIGRLATRVWYAYHRSEADLTAINTSGSMDLAGWAFLLKYDTTFGQFAGKISYDEHQPAAATTPSDPLLGHLIFDETLRVPVLAERNPSQIPWASYGEPLVIECTGAFLTEAKASQHFQGGASRVIISAPGKDDTISTLVKGVSEPDEGRIVSNASCTTNCIAPIIQVLSETFGIEKAMLNTIHSATDDQNLQDGSHSDLRRARAASQNIVPTTTGAAKTAGKVVSGLSGLFDGLSIRVPTLTGSLADVTAVLKTPVTVAQLNEAFITASHSPRWSGIIATSDEPLVSSDIIGRSESAIIDLALTNVVGGNLVKIIAWYDNEWGFSNRLVEMAIKLAK